MSTTMTEKLENAGREGMKAAEDSGGTNCSTKADVCHDAKIDKIREHMEVIASCGSKVGEVDALEGPAIKLTKSASPDGEHHFIPVTWVTRVDSQVHLSKNSRETESEWQSTSASCTCHS